MNYFPSKFEKKAAEIEKDPIKAEAIHRLMLTQGLTYEQARKRVLEQSSKEPKKAQTEWHTYTRDEQGNKVEVKVNLTRRNPLPLGKGSSQELLNSTLKYLERTYDRIRR